MVTRKKSAWYEAVESSAKRKIAIWLAIAALGGVVFAAVFAATEKASRLLTLNSQLEARGAYLDYWMRSVKAAGSAPRIPFAQEVQPLEFSGNVAVLVDQLEKMSKHLNPHSNQRGFQEWLANHRVSVEPASDEERKMQALNIEPAFNDKDVMRVVERMMTISDNFADKAAQLKSLSGGKANSNDLTAAQYYAVVTYVGQPWLVPFGSIRATSPVGYWKYWPRFDCAIRQYLAVTFDERLAMQRPMPECSLVEGLELPELGDQSIQMQSHYPNQAGERLRDQLQLMKDFKQTYALLSTNEKALGIESLTAKQTADKKEAVELAKVVLGFDSVAWEKIPVPAHAGLFLYPVLVGTFALFLSIQNAVLRGKRKAEAPAELALIARVPYPKSLLFRMVSVILVILMVSATFYLGATAPWLSTTEPSIKVAQKYYGTSEAWFQNSKAYVILCGVALALVIVELTTMVRVTSGASPAIRRRERT